MAGRFTGVMRPGLMHVAEEARAIGGGARAFESHFTVPRAIVPASGVTMD